MHAARGIEMHTLKIASLDLTYWPFAVQETSKNVAVLVVDIPGNRLGGGGGLKGQLVLAS